VRVWRVKNRRKKKHQKGKVVPKLGSISIL
jgi:hypothetical protein